MSATSRQKESAPLVLLSPGHGLYNHPTLGWRFGREYFFGIVEDLVNAELAMSLDNLLRSSSLNVRSARQLDKEAGLHPDSQAPWWHMDAGAYVRSLGAPDYVWAAASIPYNRHITVPPRYGNWISADLLLSVHNNGSSNAKARGTLVLFDTSNGYQDQSRRLADIVHRHLIAAIRSQWDPDWYSFGVAGSNGGYGENRIFQGPAVLVEIAFMDNPADNAALQDNRFRNIVTQAMADAILEFTGSSQPNPAPPSAPTTFVGSPSSRLYVSGDGMQLQLEVCADNLPGETVHLIYHRDGTRPQSFAQTATSRCTTFVDVDGPGSVDSTTSHFTWAALNDLPNQMWPIPCYRETGGRGLCDIIGAAAWQSPGPTVFDGNVQSRLFVDRGGERINLEVCADTLPGQSVSAQLSRSGKTWDVLTQRAAGRCVTFWDMDGAGPLLSGRTYRSRAALNQSPDPGWPVPCFNASGKQGLCDEITTTADRPEVFQGGVASRLYFDQSGERINLDICADNLPDQTVMPVSGVRAGCGMWYPKRRRRAASLSGIWMGLARY